MDASVVDAVRPRPRALVSAGAEWPYLLALRRRAWPERGAAAVTRVPTPVLVVLSGVAAFLALAITLGTAAGLLFVAVVLLAFAVFGYVEHER